jgi:glycosyltransferase involved in cell wall biosynthesis
MTPSSSTDRAAGPSAVSFTVAVCAFNATARIHRALDALAEVEYAGPWEVLIVDNASTDGTAELALRWRARLPGLRVVREAVPGLAYARRKALASSERDFVCFVDDDNLIAPDYLAIADAILRSEPGIGVLASRSELFEIEAAPAWFGEASSCYAVGRIAERDGFLAPNAIVWGAGFIVRRAAWLSARDKGFEPLLQGRKGNVQLAGEDSELALALNILGWRSYYASALRVRHAIEPARMNLDTLEAMNRGFGISHNVLETYKSFLEPGPKRWVKRSDPACAVLVLWRLARAAVMGARARELSERIELWRAIGRLHGFWSLGLRPSRVLRAEFFRRVMADAGAR